MAYRETALVRAHKAAQAEKIIAAAIDLAEKGGLSAITSNAIAARAGVSMGKIFNYYPSMDELCAQVDLTLIRRDVTAMQAAADMHDDATRRLSAGMLAILAALASRASHEAVTRRPAYRTALAIALGKLIGPLIDQKGEARPLARAALGVIAAAADDAGPASRNASRAVLFVLRGLGVSEATAQRAIEAV